eukprot:TRINITY_DN18692_c0_g1_i1.p1 TRINITY_DN18692_c0_g1~~TRINITY_DN18692_c0_g1_i1.p1  ORF type:complete len:598 (-),score=82.73 TRINITY_DN18692_c0_g1_i1:879-2672(-)
MDAVGTAVGSSLGCNSSILEGISRARQRQPCSQRAKPFKLQNVFLADRTRRNIEASRLYFRNTQSLSRRRVGVTAECVPFSETEAYLDDVPHISQWLPKLQVYPNPLQTNSAFGSVTQYFVEEDDVVAQNVVVKMQHPCNGRYFRRAGPRQQIVFKPEEVKAAIVTCGGLCPGLNTVIREIVSCLWTQYNVHDIIGIEGGYRGFYARNTIAMNPKVVGDIHKRGGTILGTSRGGHSTSKIVNSIEDRGINQVYIVGGDGTQRGADIIHQEIMRRGLQVSVAGIPKTIDNDLAVIDKSFGFDTAVEEAQRAINAAHTEAESVQNGIGLVKLMGRYSGYIAMHATLASRDVDCCLIPEVPFYLDGPGGLIEFVEKRLRENGHMVLVVAEGAGQELIAETIGKSMDTSDASGNRLLLDVGHWLSNQLKEHFLKTHKEGLNLKYIDPTYMIRAVPPNASDNVYCTLLAHSAVHGAMAGYTGFTVGPVNGRHAYIPIARVAESQNKVSTTDRMWARLLSSTSQPSFRDYAERREKVEEKRKDAEDWRVNHLGDSHSAADPPSQRHSSVENGNGNGDGGFHTFSHSLDTAVPELSTQVDADVI